MKMTKIRIFSIILVTFFVFGMLPEVNGNNNSMVIIDESNEIGGIWPPTPLQTMTESLKQTANENDSAMYVWWDQQSDFINNTWDWSWSNWEFGPTPSYTFTFINNTPIDKDTVVPIDETIQISIKVPVDSLSGAQMGFAGVSFNLWLYDQTGGTGYSANIQVGYNFQWQNWVNDQYEWNYSYAGEGNQLVNFFDFDSTSSTALNDSDNYYVVIIGSFTSTAPQGVWNMNLDVFDENWQWIGYGYEAWRSENPPYRDVIIGDISPGFGFGPWGGFDFAKKDNLGNPIITVAREQPFQLCINTTTPSDLDYVAISFNLPYAVVEKVNVTEEITEETTETGGWVWNDDTQQYEYNATIEVPVSEKVIKEYEKEVIRYVDRSTEINGYWAYPKLYIIYNATTNTGYLKLGYEYWDDVTYEYKIEWEDIDPNSIEDNIYELYGFTVSQPYDDSYSICFNGSFTEHMLPDSSVWFQVDIKDDNKNWIAPRDWSEYQKEQQLAIDTLAAVTKVFDENGKEVEYTLRTDIGDFFIVDSVLTGLEEDDNIDAISLVLRASDGYWSEEESRWEGIELVVRYDLTTGEVTVDAFNRTERWGERYGEYWDWVEVEVEKYDWLWNETLGDWVWTFGNFTEWQWTLVEGWYWYYEVYDQVNGEWVDDWLPDRSPLTKVGDSSNPFLTVNSVDVVFSDGLIAVEFNISANSLTPEKRYWFETNFETLEFKEDYRYPWGEYYITSWTEEEIYYIRDALVGDPLYYVDMRGYPLSLTYNNETYLVEEKPFIVIDGKREFIKTFSEYDWWSSETREFFLREDWDPVLQENRRYFTLLNDTTVEVDEDKVVTVYEIKLNATEDNTTTFKTLNRWTENIRYDYGTNRWEHTWTLVDGSTFTFSSVDRLESEPYYDNYGNEHRNVTGYIYLSMTNYIPGEPVHFLVYGHYDSYYNFIIDGNIEITSEWFHYNWQSDYYYVIGVDGSIYQAFNAGNYQYEITIDGTTYKIWDTAKIETLYPVTIDGTDYYVSERFVRPFFNYQGQEVPYTGAFANYWWDLDHKRSQGGVIPTEKYVEIDGNMYQLTWNLTGWFLFDLSNSSDLGTKLDKGLVRNDILLAYINGQPVWNITQNGYIIDYTPFCHRDLFNGEFNAEGNFAATTYLNSEKQWVADFIQKDVYWFNDSSNSKVYVDKQIAVIIFEIEMYDLELNYHKFNSTVWYPYGEDYTGITGVGAWIAVDGSEYYFNMSLGGSWDFANITTVYVYDAYQLGNGYEWVFDWDYTGETHNIWWDPNYDFFTLWYYNTTISGTNYYMNYWNSWDQNATDPTNFTLYLYSQLDFTAGINPNVGYDSYFRTYVFDNPSTTTMIGNEETGNPFHNVKLYLINATDETEIDVYDEDYVVIYQIMINDTYLINVTNYWNYETVEYYNSTLGYYIYLYNKITDIDGVEWHFDWGSYQFVDEVHVWIHKQSDGTEYFEFNGNTYYIDDFYSTGGITRVNSYWIINNTGYWLELEDSYKWTPYYQVELGGILYNITKETQYIYKRHKTWGFPSHWMYIPLPVQEFSNVWSIVIGNPTSGMWGFQAFEINPENGALDLDGDLDTIDDQYYVRRVWHSTDQWTEDNEWLWVHLLWDPELNGSNDEYDLNGWMGLHTITWSWSWEETFYWYHADTMQLLTTSEMEAVQDILFDDEGNPAPGYWGIAYMGKNTTWADVQAEALENGWDWALDNEQTVTWLDFNFAQHYKVNSGTVDEPSLTDVSLIYQWAGLSFYNDTDGDGIMQTDERTHFFIPEGVEEVEFNTPGMKFGNMDNSGYLELAINETVDFGVNFLNVTGTSYPAIEDEFGRAWSFWDWSDTAPVGDLNTFFDRPTNTNVSNLLFLIHFTGEVTDDESNNEVELKLDQEIGTWNVDFARGRENLENLSLATHYYALVETSTHYEVVNEDNGTVSNDDTVESSLFRFTTEEGAEFAETLLKAPYVWGKNTSRTYNATSSTTPISSFRESYESEGEHRTFGFDFERQLYFLTVGFPYWDGFEVLQDPTYAAVTAKATEAGSEEDNDPPVITEHPVNQELAEGSYTLSWTAYDSNPETYTISHNGKTVASGSWSSGSPVTYNTGYLSSGSHTYTITFYDEFGNYQSHTVVLTITSSGGTTVKTTSLSTSVPEEKPAGPAPGFEFFIVIVLIAILPIVRNRRKK